jgi:hypothetical protein
MLTIYLSLTKRLLVDSKEESHELIQHYYTKAIELLKKPNECKLSLFIGSQ